MTDKHPPESDPMTVDVLDDEVAITGPDGLGISLTPESAAESGRRLIEAARRVQAGKGHVFNGTEDADIPGEPS